MTAIRTPATVAVLGLLLAVCIAQPASAQRGRGLLGLSRVQLATLDEVQAELKLTDDQKQFVEQVNEKLSEERREIFRGGAGGDFAAMREKMEKMNAEASAKVVGKLDEAQQKRLTEIFVQVSGPLALGDPDVAKTLGLSAEQQESLAAASDENRQEAFQAFRNFREMSDEERAEAREKLRKNADERMLAVLTPEQQQQFATMKGEALEVDLSQLFRRRGGGGQAGRGGDRPRRPE